MFDLRLSDLDALNSLTKYPSIPTYHTLDARGGGLLDESVRFSGQVLGTEKIDGTNARIVCLPDGSYVIGSREELLYAKGDLIGNPALGIVDALRPLADALAPVADDVIRVHYLEVYGGRITAGSKHYTGARRVGYRLFDVAVLTAYPELLGRPLAAISAWREDGGQTYLDEDELSRAADRDGVPVAPRLFLVDAADLPTDIARTREFLAERLPRTRSALDGGAAGLAEGVVLRTLDRAQIAKARFTDYDRTLRRRRWPVASGPRSTV